jgi:hypothetical protein
MTVDNETRPAFRVPHEPYPGLRPFLDHESVLLLGRGRQINEVIARLGGESHFVVVIGGSGCGKSSLIRAGVVPALRGFGIRTAGDYWVPVVCTPGTTKLGSADPVAAAMDVGRADNASVNAAPLSTPVPVTAPLSTPVTRLAWKFSKVLSPAVEANARRKKREAERLRIERERVGGGESIGPGEASPSPKSPDAEAQEARRRDDIAEMFRQGGFSRLVKEMSEELPRVGPNPDDARFLFVIDQFEELFHPNNHGNADAAAIVDAVVNHFFDPHPRCFVVLTMRSEHLADCAAYLELPDAINTSSYLVRRLDEGELREAIEGPAKYFLRIQRRGEMSARDLPDDVVFDEDVVQRLLADVSAITDDPDHLPLLQHVLARTWESACGRIKSEPGAPRVPGRIAWPDLEHAVNPTSTRPEGWLRGQPATNALRESLENWAEDAYRTRSLEEQAQVDRVLRQLAFKDPNNGQYTQQRLEVDKARVFDGTVQPKERLHALLQSGFLDTVNYLFWDTENPDHVTLKVSHESFIRGWRHFRGLVDEEANHFDEFVGLLRKCVAWRQSSESRTQRQNLLERSDFDRLKAAGLVPVLEPGKPRDDWFETLTEYRDGDRFAVARDSLDDFVRVSQARLDRASATRRRQTAGVAIAILVAAVVLPVAGYSYWVQSPAMVRIAEFANARDLVQRNSDKGQYSYIDEPGKLLRQLMLAAATFDKPEHSTWAVKLSEWIGDIIRGQGFHVIGTKRLLALTTSEPEVNGTVRRMLNNNAWPVAPGASSPAASPHVSVCTLIDPGGKVGPTGQAFRREGTDRAIFVASPVSGLREPTTIYEVTWSDANPSECTHGRTMLALPPDFEPAILFDATTEHMAIAVAGGGFGPASVTLYSVAWAPSPDNKSLIAWLRQRGLVTDPNVVKSVQDQMLASEAGKSGARAAVVPTWFTPGGVRVEVTGQSWRLFSEAAQRIDGAPETWTKLGDPETNCAALEKMLKAGAQPGFDSEMHQYGERCFEIQHGNPQGMDASPDEAVLVAVYAKPLDVDKLNIGDAPPAAIASLSAFGRFPRRDTATWMVGDGGAFDGWIARKETDANGTTTYDAAPWSTPAVKRLAQSVLPVPASSPPRR